MLSLEKRVINVVKAWADPSPIPIKKSSAIKDIWGNRADTIPFPDPATRNLITALQTEFRSGPDARVLTGLIPASFDTTGSIKTLDDLIVYVDNSPVPQHFVLAGFANDSVKTELASAIADALHKKLPLSAKSPTKVRKPKPKKGPSAP